MGGIELGSTEKCYNLEYMVVGIVVITRNVNVIPMSDSVITRSTMYILR